jgi:hypothetical protein
MMPSPSVQLTNPGLLYHTRQCPTQEQGHNRITKTNVVALEYWGPTRLSWLTDITALVTTHQLEYLCSMQSIGTFLMLPYTLHWNTLAVCSQLVHLCCYHIQSIGIILLYVLNLYIPALTPYPPLKHSGWYPIPSIGKSLLYVLYWNILAVTLYPPLEHSRCYPIPSTGIIYLLQYTRHLFR